VHISPPQNAGVRYHRRETDACFMERRTPSFNVYFASLRAAAEARELAAIVAPRNVLAGERDGSRPHAMVARRESGSPRRRLCEFSAICGGGVPMIDSITGHRDAGIPRAYARGDD
jgi:hypothetical protein